MEDARGQPDDSNCARQVACVIAELTTQCQVGRILAGLGLRDRAQADVLAQESGLGAAGGYSTDE